MINQKIIKIVSSKQSGFGKTQYIIDHHCSNNQGTLKYYYFPLSGQIQEQNLCKRFHNLIELINNDRKIHQDLKACLIVQIYNIDVKYRDEVDKFISLLSFGTYSKDGPTVAFQKELNISIYIQLENITQCSSVIENDDSPQFEMLPSLKLIKNNEVENIYHRIQTFTEKDILMRQNDIKLNYICCYLQKLFNRSIDYQQILPFQKYKFVIIQNKEVQQLIKRYFFDFFQENNKPSTYIWKYFSQLLFDKFKCFSNSYYLKLSTLEQIDSNLKDFCQKRPCLKIKNSLRSQFLQIIVSNSLQVLCRSVPLQQQIHYNIFNWKQEYLSFLIVSNHDKQSFSFIYYNSNRVPHVIKIMLVLQQPKLMMRFNVASIDQLFEEISIARLQIKAPQRWIQKASQIMQNISGNREYKINCEKNYIITIDILLKMCLISQRIKLNIPVSILNETGIGKTAMLKHIFKYIFKQDLQHHHQ